MIDLSAASGCVNAASAHSIAAVARFFLLSAIIMTHRA